jgi:hypothetical protein
LQFEASAGGPVGLGQHPRNGVAGIEDGFEGTGGKIWRTGKDDAHE